MTEHELVTLTAAILMSGGVEIDAQGAAALAVELHAEAANAIRTGADKSAGVISLSERRQEGETSAVLSAFEQMLDRVRAADGAAPHRIEPLPAAMPWGGGAYGQSFAPSAS